MRYLSPAGLEKQRPSCAPSWYSSLCLIESEFRAATKSVKRTPKSNGGEGDEERYYVDDPTAQDRLRQFLLQAYEAHEQEVQDAATA